MRKVLITGVGINCSLGPNYYKCMDSLIKISRDSKWQQNPLGSLGAYDIASSALEEAISSSAINPLKTKIGLILGFDHLERYLTSPADTLGSQFSLNGLRCTVVTPFISGAQAIIQAYDIIRNGFCDVIIAGGCNSLSEHQNQPNTTGGAAFLVLEEKDHALARKAKISVSIAGYGTAHKNNSELLCMNNALKASGIGAESIDVIIANKTGLPQNDSKETEAISHLFQNRSGKILITALKSMTGHTLAASGAIEAAISVLLVRTGIIPALNNLDTKDHEPICSLMLHEPVLQDIQFALFNCFSINGGTVSMVFQKEHN